MSHKERWVAERNKGYWKGLGWRETDVKKGADTLFVIDIPEDDNKEKVASKAEELVEAKKLEKPIETEKSKEPVETEKAEETSSELEVLK